MKLHQIKIVLLVSNRYHTGFGGLDNLKDKQKLLLVVTNSIWYSFYFHQAAPGEMFPDDLTPLDVYMPIIGKCLLYWSKTYYAYVYFTYPKFCQGDNREITLQYQ